MFATKGWYTENDLYFVADGSEHLLYAKKDAPDPQPTSLFTKSKSYYLGWVIWTPNVQFLTNEKGTVMEQFKSAMGSKSENQFIFGKNDCANFATALSSLYGEQMNYAKDSYKLQGKDEIEGFDVQVGDMMKHMYPNSSTCEYHAATIVAVDDGDLVTLEAHVSKSLSRPQFHIREGVWGFVKDNDPNNNQGNIVHVGQENSDIIKQARTYMGYVNSKEFQEYDKENFISRGLVAT